MASGSSRLAEIRPEVSLTRFATRSATSSVPGPLRLLDQHTAGLMKLDDPLHRLVGRAAACGRPSITAHVSVGGNQPIRSVALFNGDLCVVMWLVGTATVTTLGLAGSHDTTNEEWGL